MKPHIYRRRATWFVRWPGGAVSGFESFGHLLEYAHRDHRDRPLERVRRESRGH